MNKRIDLLLATRNRPTEVGLLLQSLRTQIYQDYDIFLLDDASTTPITNYYFIVYLLNRLKCEGHKVYIKRNNVSNGISRMRNQMVKWACEESSNDLICRVDDDVLVEPDFLERLVTGIEEGYDLMSGITPPLAQEMWKRNTTHVKPLISKCEMNDEGTLLVIGDDCGYGYLQDEIIASDHFRSSALYKKSIHTKNNIYYFDGLTKCGFREEEFFSFQIICAGLRIGVDTQAIVYHFLTPSGGDKRSNYAELAKLNHESLIKYTKKLFDKHGNFLKKYEEMIINEKKE